ncbi:MAG: O-acetyl-ADP-ribose deacetylase [Deltaproteobacteria bacterium]|nr:O-acetyl-ADP-ribose deacetylase [Deltaproteobacteria bacterium]
MPHITIVRGDITVQRVDAIVNAANESCLGGGGVDGAIHRAAGPELLQACRRLPEQRPGVRCPTGKAVVTPGFLLPARYVIHAVGPRYHEPNAAFLLASAYRSALELAEGLGVRTIAFPAISCGAYGYPAAEAAPIAIKVCREREWPLEEIRFVLFNDETYEAFERALAGRG